VSSQPEKWISIEQDVLDSLEWTLKPFPRAYAEPSEQPPEPVQEAAPTAAEEVAPPPVPAPRPRPKPAAPRRRVRPRIRWRRALALLAAVLGLAAGIGAGVAVVLGNEPGSDVAADVQPRGPGVTPGAPADPVVLADPSGRRHTCTVLGTDDDEVVEGTRIADVLCGLGGDDVITGGTGDDVALGGPGGDKITGGPGADRLYGEEGRDSLHGRDGSADRIDGGPGRDRADLGPLDRGINAESLAGPVVVAAGDIACDPRADSFEAGQGTPERCRQGHTGALVEALEPNAVLALGDLQYEVGRYRKYLRSYDPTWGRFKDITHPTPGGEEDGPGRAGYRRYWGARAGATGLFWYSFDLGSWHIVSLNSNCPEFNSCDAGSLQEQWLRADLAANSSRCTLAFWHEPRYSSAGQSALKMTAIWQALYEGGAELVLSGDAHNYERFAPMGANGDVDRARGIRQFVVGTGGESLQRFKRRQAGSLVRRSGTFGVLELRLHPGSYDWRFVRESGRPFTDSGSADCH
jgi:hemolysin type calcium-binding protein